MKKMYLILLSLIFFITSCNNNLSEEEKKALWDNAQTQGEIVRRSGTPFNLATDKDLAMSDAQNRLRTGGGLMGEKANFSFLDGSEKSAVKFIHNTLIQLKDHADENLNYKGTLIELSHRRGLSSPSFELINTSGPEHDKIFHIRLKVSNGAIYNGTGSSKKAAEQDAAKLALESIQTS